MNEVTAVLAPSQELALNRVTAVRLGRATRKLGRELFDAVVDIGADGTWTHTPGKEDIGDSNHTR